MLWMALPVKLSMGNAVHFNKKTPARVAAHQVALESPELIRYSRKTLPTAQGICRSSCIWVLRVDKEFKRQGIQLPLIDLLVKSVYPMLEKWRGLDVMGHGLAKL
jgi:hypothetical protein